MIKRLLIAVSPLFLSPLCADEMELADGGRLSGSVLSISPDGVIEAKLEVAQGTARIRADEIRRVRFGKTFRKSDHDAMLTLTNGDRLPCDILAIGGEDLTVDTHFAGTLVIPRRMVTTAQLGIRPRKTVYRGPENLKGWEVEQNWHFEDGGFVSDARGSISRQFDGLPDSFSLSFRLDWTSQPNFQIYFLSTDRKGVGRKDDRYYLQFGSAGAEIKRQTSSGTGAHSLVTVNRSHEDFPDRAATIEIRFDSTQRLLRLYVNGQLEGQASDPIDEVPEGNGIVLQSNSSEAEAHRVSEILIREWDAAGDRHRSEDRGELGEDALINNEGQRFGGRLIESEGKGRDMVMLFKSPLSPKPLRIPAPETSTLFFKEPEDRKSEEHPLALGLTDSGMLSARSCSFGLETVELNHPLLGSLTVDREVVKLLERSDEPEGGTGE